MKRLSAFSNRHPLLSILAGWIFLVAITIILVPADPPSIAQAMHERAST